MVKAVDFVLNVSGDAEWLNGASICTYCINFDSFVHLATIKSFLRACIHPNVTKVHRGWNKAL